MLWSSGLPSGKGRGLSLLGATLNPRAGGRQCIRRETARWFSQLSRTTGRRSKISENGYLDEKPGYSHMEGTVTASARSSS